MPALEAQDPTPSGGVRWVLRLGEGAGGVLGLGEGAGRGQVLALCAPRGDAETSFSFTLRDTVTARRRRVGAAGAARAAWRASRGQGRTGRPPGRADNGLQGGGAARRPCPAATLHVGPPGPISTIRVRAPASRPTNSRVSRGELPIGGVWSRDHALLQGTLGKSGCRASRERVDARDAGKEQVQGMLGEGGCKGEGGRSCRQVPTGLSALSRTQTGAHDVVRAPPPPSSPAPDLPSGCRRAPASR